MTYEATTSALPRADPDAPGPWMVLPAVALNHLIYMYFLPSGRLGARDESSSGPDGYMRLVRAGGGLRP
jgi:hypothetical protein